MERIKDQTEGVARVLSLTLPEPRWRALLEVEPEPIAWLQQQIQQRLQEAAADTDSDCASAQGLYASGGIS